MSRWKKHSRERGARARGAVCLLIAIGGIISVALGAGLVTEEPARPTNEELEMQPLVAQQVAPDQLDIQPVMTTSDVSIGAADSVAMTGELTNEDARPLVRQFDGRPIRPARRMTMRVTGYSPDERSCGKFADGRTASGYSVWTNGMKLAAADARMLPFGALISVPGYDFENVIPVLDRGGRIKGNRLDLLFPTHEQARRWGVRDLTITIWEYADGEPNHFVSGW